MKKLFSLFGFRLILRLTLVLANMASLTIIFGDARLFFNQIILGIILIIQVAELIRFVNVTNRELSKFLLAIKHSDFSINFNKNKIGSSFTLLNQAFEDIIESYKEAKVEREAQFQYLRLVVSRMSAGIISIENNLDIVLMNEPAEEALGVTGIKNWRILSEKLPQFAKEIEAMEDESKKLIELNSYGDKKTLSVEVKQIIILDKAYKLITFQDIQGVIEEKEIEAWHKLIRILTHEIMNSVTPISSLTETMHSMLEKNGQKISTADMDEEIIDDLIFSLKTIQRRSNGMLAFIDDYRKLTRVAKPTPAPVKVQELIDGIKVLMHNEVKKEKIDLRTEIFPTDLVFNVDAYLIEQVLINLVTNAIHALSGIPEGAIKIIAYIDKGHKIIEITDNGHGIGDKELKEIFIPFFTTKNEGSGIGLSLSKQIMHLHGGTIKVQSEKNRGTSFFLTFR